MKEDDAAKSQERRRRRGSDYVAIFVRQLGGTVVLAPAGNRDYRADPPALPPACRPGMRRRSRPDRVA